MAASPGGVEVGRISVRVVPDTSRLGADLKVALDRIEAQTDLKISTSIDTTLLDAQAKAAVEQAQVAAGNIHIKTEVDTSQVREAESALSGASGAASGFTSGLGGIATAAIVLGPALIPLVAVVGALGAALLAPLAITAGGLTIFGFLAGFAVSTTQKQLKQIQTLETSLGGLTKGTAAYTAKAKELHAAQAALTPAQKSFATALNALKGVFQSVPLDIVLKPVTAALNLLAKVLPILTPVVRAASSALSGLLGDVSKAAGSQGFKDFVRAFAHQLGPDIKAFATIAGNVFKGLTGLFFAFNKQLSGSVLKSLVNLTKKFATWGQTLGESKGFKSFVQYVKEVGPKVAAALGAIAAAAGAIVVAFAPVGTVVLQGITAVGNAIGKIPTDTLVTLAASLVALTVASKALGPFTTLLGTIGLSQPEIILVVAAIAALTVGFIALYRNSKPLQNVLADLGTFFKDTLLPVIGRAAGLVGTQLSAAFADISKSVKENKPFLEAMGKALLVVVSEAVISGLLFIAANIRVIGKVIAVGITVVHRWADVWLLEIAFIIRAIGLMQSVVLASFGKIVDAAAAAFGWIPTVGKNFTRAQSNFHAFADAANQSLASAANSVDNFRHSLDNAVKPPKPIKITVDDLAAVKQLEALRGLVDRVVGPGGGIGQPARNSAGLAPTPAPQVQNGPTRSGSGGGATKGGDTYNIEAHDYHDFLRQLATRKRGQSGGGVLLPSAGGVR